MSRVIVEARFVVVKKSSLSCPPYDTSEDLHSIPLARYSAACPSRHPPAAAVDPSGSFCFLNRKFLVAIWLVFHCVDGIIMWVAAS